MKYIFKFHSENFKIKDILLNYSYSKNEKNAEQKSAFDVVTKLTSVSEINISIYSVALIKGFISIIG